MSDCFKDSLVMCIKGPLTWNFHFLRFLNIMSSPSLYMVAQRLEISIGVNWALAIPFSAFELDLESPPYDVIWREGNLPFLCFAHPESLARPRENARARFEFFLKRYHACKWAKHGSWSVFACRPTNEHKSVFISFIWASEETTG